MEPLREIRQEETDVRAAQSGDVRAFERLYRAHVGRVFALCARMSGSRTMAEELTQDAFVRAWERLASFRGESAFGTWLYRIAASEVIDQARARARRLRHEEAVEDVEVHASPAPDPAHAPMDVERALAALPEGARRVLVLHDVAGFTHEEIGRMTGSAEGTCKAQLHRARKLLKEALS